MKLDFTPATSKQKRERWLEYQKSRVSKLEALAAWCYSPDAKEELGRLSQLEFFGGHCPLCNQEWEHVEYENALGYCNYFRPVCDCYPLCPDCGSYLHEEKASGVLKMENWHCTNCGWLLISGVVRRWGKDYKAQDFKRDKLEDQRAERQAWAEKRKSDRRKNVA